MKKLRLYRLMSGKTQKQIAEKVGCTQALISMFESGRLIPGNKLRKALARALNKTEDEIFPKEHLNE